MNGEWKICQVKDIVDPLKGSVVTGPFGSSIGRKYWQDKGIPVIRGNNIVLDGSDFIDKNYIFISEEYYLSKMKRYTSVTDDIIFTAVGTIGQVGIIPKNTKYPFYIVSNKQMRLRVNKKIVDPRFAFYHFRTKRIKQLILANNTGSTIPLINLRVLKNLPFPLPPLPEQKAISSILSALDDKIELNLQMNKTLEEMAMALYKHWFVDFAPFQNGKFIDSELGRIPEGWEVKRLDSLIKFSNGYAFKSKQLLKKEEADSDCYHVFKMGHISKGGGLKANGTKSWIKKEDCKKLDKYILKVGDILMSMTDMKDKMTILGHTALMNENEKYIVNQRVGLLRINNKINVGYPFIYMLTNSFYYIGRLRSQANSGVQVNLSTGAIKASEVITPTSEINKKFHEIVLPFFQRINENSIENQTLTQLRNAILPKLISGEVRVKDIENIVKEAL